jgi:hypothetical protein
MSPNPRTDFDPVTGKLVPVESIVFETEPTPEPDAPTAAKPSVLANPAALAPTGSKPGRLAFSDGFRSLLTGVGVFGALQIAVKVLEAAGQHPSLLGTHGTEIAAFSVSLAHLITSYMSDNTPRQLP